MPSTPWGALQRGIVVVTPGGFHDRDGFCRQLATLQAVAGLPVTPRASEVACLRLLVEVQRALGPLVTPPLD